MYVFGEWHDEQNYAIGENYAIVSSCAIERLSESIFGAYAKRRIEAERKYANRAEKPPFNLAAVFLRNIFFGCFSHQARSPKGAQIETPGRRQFETPPLLAVIGSRPNIRLLVAGI